MFVPRVNFSLFRKDKYVCSVVTFELTPNHFIRFIWKRKITINGSRTDNTALEFTLHSTVCGAPLQDIHYNKIIYVGPFHPNSCWSNIIQNFLRQNQIPKHIEHFRLNQTSWDSLWIWTNMYRIEFRNQDTNWTHKILMNKIWIKLT